jgi:tetratricopeptide (TPR) repeat protein
VTDQIHVQNKIEQFDAQTESGEKDPAQDDFDSGKRHLAAGDAVQAAGAFHNALVGFEQSGNEKGIANAVNQLGDICMTRENYEQGLAHFERAYRICEKLEDPFSLLALKKKMAQAQRCLKQYAEAVGIYMDVLDIYSAHNNPQGAVTILEELAGLYLEMGERDRAADAYRTAASIHKNFKHSRETQRLLDQARALEDA